MFGAAAKDVKIFPDGKIEGILKKKNSKGVWKDRFCVLANERFQAYKSKGKTPCPTNEIKEDVDVRLVNNVTVSDNILYLSLLNGVTMEFMGPSVSVWKETIRSIINRRISVDDVSSREKVYLSGKLLKKSHNKYQMNLQVRMLFIIKTNSY